MKLLKFFLREFDDKYAEEINRHVDLIEQIEVELEMLDISMLDVHKDTIYFYRGDGAYRVVFMEVRVLIQNIQLHIYSPGGGVTCSFENALYRIRKFFIEGQRF